MYSVPFTVRRVEANVIWLASSYKRFRLARFVNHSPFLFWEWLFFRGFATWNLINTLSPFWGSNPLMIFSSIRFLCFIFRPAEKLLCFVIVSSYRYYLCYATNRAKLDLVVRINYRACSHYSIAIKTNHFTPPYIRI